MNDEDPFFLSLSLFSFGKMGDFLWIFTYLLVPCMVPVPVLPVTNNKLYVVINPGVDYSNSPRFHLFVRVIF